jgi:hypothetical protein
LAPGSDAILDGGESHNASGRAAAARWTQAGGLGRDAALFSEETTVPKYLIEREFAGAGALNSQQLTWLAQKSCNVIHDIGPQIQWLESFVTDDKIYCVYIAPNPELIREHARRGGFPASRVSEVKSVICPITAE